MDTKRVIMVSLQLILLVVISQYTEAAVQTHSKNHEVKPGAAFSMCGQAFVVVWKHLCRYNKHKRAKRSIESKLSRI